MEMNISSDDLLAFSSQQAVPYIFVFAVCSDYIVFVLKGDILKLPRGKIYRFAHIMFSM